MTHSIVLYRVILNGEYAVLLPYNERNQKIGIFNQHPAKIVRQIEAEWERKASGGSRGVMEVSLDWLYLNPSVVSIGKKLDALVQMGIIQEKFTLQKVSFFGTPKFVAGNCNGPNAMEYWEKGLKPRLPKEIDNESLNRRARLPNPIPVRDGPARATREPIGGA